MGSTIVINDHHSNSKCASWTVMEALRTLQPDNRAFWNEHFSLTEIDILESIKWLSNRIYFKQEEEELTLDDLSSGLNFLTDVILDMRSHDKSITVAYWE